MQEEFVISSPKQENGLWGMPLQCIKLEWVPLSEENELKHSAILMAIAESHPEETFELFWPSESNFYIKLSKSGIKSIVYDYYHLEGNKLTWICKKN